jgi:hypothetical protein
MGFALELLQGREGVACIYRRRAATHRHGDAEGLNNFGARPRSIRAKIILGVAAGDPTNAAAGDGRTNRICSMTPHIVELTTKIRELEAELDAELAQRRAELRVGMERGRVFFEEEILRRHRELKTRLSTYILNAHPLVVLTAPVIYALIVPFVLLDLFVTLYQAVCFPAYGIPKVRRGDYLVFDRHHLAYLNALEKLNCAYCSYANGLIAYVREIAGRTEQYWCPIKHAKRVIGAHPRYATFEDYGDADGYRKWLAHFTAATKDKE